MVVTWTSALTRNRSPRLKVGIFRGASVMTTFGVSPGCRAIGIVVTRSELFPVVTACALGLAAAVEVPNKAISVTPKQPARQGNDRR